MTDWHATSEQERASTMVSQCEGRLRRAQENVRCAGEALRRAVRAAMEAEGELRDATRRLSRMEVPMRDGRDGLRLDLMIDHGARRRSQMQLETERV
jgi:hypothetical protein